MLACQPSGGHPRCQLAKTETMETKTGTPAMGARTNKVVDSLARCPNEQRL